MGAVFSGRRGTKNLGLAILAGSALVAGCSRHDGAPPPRNEPRNTTLPDLSREREFDGLDLAQLDRFWEKWHLVTVRYRTDNREQRFVYANDLAYAALLSHAEKYPEGAMFGKIAFLGEADDAFPSSLEPRRFTRLQLMRKDSPHHPDSDGWGYAVYAMGTGVPYAAAKDAVVACHACHRLVPARDFVFSRSAFGPNGGDASVVNSAFRNRFSRQAFAQLGGAGRKAAEAVGVQDGDLQVYEMPLFAGSVNESLLPLVSFAREAQRPFLLFDGHSDFFLAAMPVPKREAKCAGEIRLAQLRTVRSTHPGVSPKTEIVHGRACGDELDWGETGR